MITFVETELTSNIETELMILDTPIDLIIEHIRAQINRSYGSINYLNTVSDKLSYMETEYEDDSDTIFKINEMRVMVFSEVAEILKEFFNIDLNIDYNFPKEAEEIVSDLYQFFIVNSRKTTLKFLNNFIKEQKKTIVEELELTKPNKDVVTTSYRKKLKSVDVKIISNLYEVVDHILNLEVPDDRFLEYTRNESVADLYRRGILSGDIYDQFKLYIEDKRIVHDVIPELFTKLKGKE